MRALLWIFLTSVGGCATDSPARTDQGAAACFCAIAEPLRLTAGEWAALSDGSARQIERHLVAGERLCGW